MQIILFHIKYYCNMQNRESTEGYSRWKVRKRHKFRKTDFNNLGISKARKGTEAVSGRISDILWHSISNTNAPCDSPSSLRYRLWLHTWYVLFWVHVSYGGLAYFLFPRFAIMFYGLRISNSRRYFSRKTGPGERRSQHPLFASSTRCKCSMEISEFGNKRVGN